MEVWKEFEANQLTHSAAHYLVAVHDILSERGYARSADVAKKLGIARSSASLGLKALIEKKYLKEDENKFIQITSQGQRLAEEIIGKKLVLKRFFQDEFLPTTTPRLNKYCQRRQLPRAPLILALFSLFCFLTSP